MYVKQNLGFFCISDLKADLRLFYREKTKNLYFSPLLPDSGDDLTKLYVPAKIHKLDTNIEGKELQRPTRIQQLTSYTDIFEGKSTGLKTIYIQGEAGSGKSTFCNKIANDWCSTTLLPDNKADILKQFEFLFLISLREESGIECRILNMIKYSILKEFDCSEKYSLGFLEKVIRDERCLVILDGLDEWQHPDNLEMSCRSKSTIPHGLLSSNIVVVTLTRPWKLTDTAIKLADIDLWVEIDGVQDTNMLVENVIYCLNGNHRLSTPREAKHFFEKVKNFSSSILSIPFLVMHLICVWFEKDYLSDSKSTIYSDILDLMLIKHNKDEIDIDVETKHDIPRCFSKTECCERNKGFLEALGKLAYYTLNSNEGEKAVFDIATVEQYLNKNRICRAMSTGILTQHKIPMLNRRNNTVFFLHKSVQEFLSVYFCCTRTYNQFYSMYANALKSGMFVKYKTVPSSIFWTLSDEEDWKCRLSCEMTNRMSLLILEILSDNEQTIFKENLIKFGSFLYNGKITLNMEIGHMSTTAILLDCLRIAEGNKSLSFYPLCFCSFHKISEQPPSFDLTVDKLESIHIDCVRNGSEKMNIMKIFENSCETLRRVVCSTDTSFDLTSCINLEHFVCRYNNSTINTKCLHSCILKRFDLETEGLWDSLQYSTSTLRVLVLDYCYNVDNLQKYLPTFVALETFSLEDTDLTTLDYLSFGMSLKHIKLMHVQMSEKAWLQTLTSLPSEINQLGLSSSFEFISPDMWYKIFVRLVLIENLYILYFLHWFRDFVKIRVEDMKLPSNLKTIYHSDFQYKKNLNCTWEDLLTNIPKHCNIFATKSNE